MNMRWFEGLKDARKRLLWCGVAAGVMFGVVLCISPAQGAVTLYKLALCLLAALCGNVVDVALFPYAQPEGYLDHDWKDEPDADVEEDADYPVANAYKMVFACALLRKAALVGMCVLAVCMGL